MGVYTLVDSIEEKVWPDAPVVIVGQGLSVDDTLATSRVTALVDMVLLVTATFQFGNVPLTGGASTILISAIRKFNTADQEKGQAGNSAIVDRDTPFLAQNAAFIEVLSTGEYIDLMCASYGETLTNITIVPALQFWILDR